MELKPYVLTASIDDEEGIRAWVGAVQAAATEVNDALVRLQELLGSAPHVHITLESSPRPDGP